MFSPEVKVFLSVPGEVSVPGELSVLGELSALRELDAKAIQTPYMSEPLF
jgi:hypothetical protein